MSEELNDEKTLEPAVQEVQAEANPVESVEEKSETVAPATTREEVIARLQGMVGDISLAKRPELESLKQVFYKLQRAA